MRQPVLLLALSLALAPAPEVQQWPGFRGPYASGVADGGAPPVSWDAATGRGILWKVAVPGLAHSSPIVWNDRVYLTTAVDRDANPQFRSGFNPDGRSVTGDSAHSWRVYAFEKQTGRKLWERIAHEGVPRTKRHPKNSHASATPVTDGRRVVAYFGSEGLFAFDLDGHLLWRQDLGMLDVGSIHYPERQWGIASSPVIFEDLVIVQSDLQAGSFLAAFDVATGREVWRVSREELPGWSSPGIAFGASRAELVTNAARYVRGYDPRTGRELWRLRNTSDITAPTPIGGDRRIFVSSGYQPQKPIFAIRTGATGDISLSGGRASSDDVIWSTTRGGSYISTPLLYRGYLYTVSANGVLACYRAATGDKIYERRIADSGGSYSASAVAADGRIYLSSEEGDVHVVAAGEEYSLLATNVMDEPLLATPAISGRLIILRTTRHLYGIGGS